MGQAPTPAELVGFESVLFDREQQRRIECGQPQDNAAPVRGLAASAASTAVVRGSRYGEYCDPRNIEPPRPGLQRAVDRRPRAVVPRAPASPSAPASQNIFDTYPEILRPENARPGQRGHRFPSGAIRYGTATPFGINGRFVYGRSPIGSDAGRAQRILGHPDELMNREHAAALRSPADPRRRAFGFAAFTLGVSQLLGRPRPTAAKRSRLRVRRARGGDDAPASVSRSSSTWSA